jgi:alpha-1,2-mannosyltransferase
MRARLEGSDSHRLVLIGEVRNKGDEQRVDELRQLARSLNVQSHVDFLINQPFAVLSSHLSSSLVFLYSMWNEHFGMGVVEAASAGLLCLAHNRGGSKEDILVDRKGEGWCGLVSRCGWAVDEWEGGVL